MTKRLSVPTLWQSSVEHRNNVVEVQPLSAIAPRALFLGPCRSLQRCPFFTVAAFLWLFVVMMIYSARKRGDHLVAIVDPTLSKRSRYCGSRLRRMLVTFRRSSLAFWRVGASAGPDPHSCCIIMCLSPKGIVLAAHRLAFALWLSACF